MTAHEQASDAVERSRRIQFLSRVGLFQVLSPLLLDDVAALLSTRSVSAHEVVVAEGDAGDALYLIDLGTFAVESAGRHVARLGPGEFFGEIALLTRGPRTATVRAETAGQMWVLAANDFHALSASQPGFAEAMQRAGGLRREQLTSQEYDVERINLATLIADRQQLRIGRLPDNDVVLDSRVVSGHHAIVRRFGDALVLEDLGSSNGTYVNGAETRRAELKDGDQIWIADQRLLFDRRHLARITEPKGVRIDAVGLRKEVKGGKNLLQDIHLTILPGEFVTIVGGSGAGKSTLMDALSGVRPATGGEVLYNGEEFYARRALYTHALGYVPQDDIIHRELPLQMTLDYAARLRLPPDTKPAERSAAVGKALAQLGLVEQRDIPVERLSGGQRKRASIGVELLTEPRVFFLDEPTSGLDPAADTAMMKLMRELTAAGSTVVLTTHATKNVVLCDKVVFLAKGGYLAYFGTPQGALDYFGTTEFDEIYDLLATGSPADWAARFRETGDYQRIVATRQGYVEGSGPAAAAIAPPRRRGGFARQLRQFAVLSSRNAQTYLRAGPPALMPLIMQPVVMALLIIATYKSGIFDANPDNPNEAASVLFIFVFLCFTFGLLYGIQVIAREFPIFRRERLVGQGVVPYVMSKLSFLGPLLVFSCFVIMVLLRLTGRLGSGDLVSNQLPLLVTAVLVATAGLSLALMTSSMAPTPTRATDMLSLWIMPQVLFGGALIAVSAMNVVGQTLSRVTVIRPGFEAAGDAADLIALVESTTNPIGQSILLQYEGFFTDYVRNWAILAIFILVPLAVSCIVLRLRTRIR